MATATRSLTSTQAADYLGVSVERLRVWENQGRIRCLHTLGGHRRFDPDELAVFRCGMFRDPPSVALRPITGGRNKTEQKPEGRGHQ